MTILLILSQNSLPRESRVEWNTKTPGGSPLYKPYRYVLPQRVGGLRGFGLKTSIDFAHLVWIRVWFLRELREFMNVFIVSIPSELKNPTIPRYWKYTLHPIKMWVFTYLCDSVAKLILCVCMVLIKSILSSTFIFVCSRHNKEIIMGTVQLCWPNI